MPHSAQPVAVGGNFGRTWINNYLALNQNSVEQNSSNNISSWGGTPKGKALVDVKLVDQQVRLTPQSER